MAKDLDLDPTVFGLPEKIDLSKTVKEELGEKDKTQQNEEVDDWTSVETGLSKEDANASSEWKDVEI